MTNLLSVLHRMVGTKEVIADLLEPLIRERQYHRIVDLGSGSGGIMPGVFEQLKEKNELEDLELLLTDLYPNKERVDGWKEVRAVSYSSESIDATNWKDVPRGLKTMINCFHHLDPKHARKVLEGASSQREPLLIYEMGENKIPLLLWWILLPLSLAILIIMSLFMTPMVRPLNWKQLLFTYIIPIVPFCYAWDGQVSIVRMYTMADMDQLLSGLETQGYQWKKGRAYKKNNKQLGTFLMGIPENN